jgi:hypothetical protein
VAVGAAGRTAGRGRCARLLRPGRRANRRQGEPYQLGAQPGGWLAEDDLQSTSPSRIWFSWAGTLGRSQHRAEHADAIQEQVVTSWCKIVDRPREGLVDSQSTKRVACTRPD